MTQIKEMIEFCFSISTTSIGGYMPKSDAAHKFMQSAHLYINEEDKFTHKRARIIKFM